MTAACASLAWPDVDREGIAVTVVRAGENGPTASVADNDPIAADADETPFSPGPRSWRSIALTVARVVFTIAVIAGIAYTVASQWPQVNDYLAELSWQSVALSLLMVLVSLSAGVLAWQAACESVGHRVPVRTASQIYLIGLLAKYLPGSVWAFVLQMELGKKANLPRARAFIASIVTVGIGVTISLLFGLFGLPALDNVGRAAQVGLLVLIPISLVCAHPAVLTRLVQLLLRLLRRPALERPFTWNGVGRVAVWSAVSLTASGAHLWLLAGSTSVSGLMGLMRCIGAIGLALTFGLFVFLVPSGIGVREAILVATLLMYVPNEGVAIAMAVTSRLIFVAGDLLAAGGAALLGIGELNKKIRIWAGRVTSVGRMRA